MEHCAPEIGPRLGSLPSQDGECSTGLDASVHVYVHEYAYACVHVGVHVHVHVCVHVDVDALGSLPS